MRESRIAASGARRPGDARGEYERLLGDLRLARRRVHELETRLLEFERRNGSEIDPRVPELAQARTRELGERVPEFEMPGGRERVPRNEGHLVGGSVVDVEDVAARHRALFNKFYAAAEQSDVSIFIVDRDGAMEYANPCSVKTFGYSVEDVLGQPVFDIAGEGVEEALRLWTILQAEGEFHGSTFAYRQDGSQLFLRGSITPIRDEQGETSHWLAILADTTEQHRVEFEKKALETRFRRVLESNIIGVLIAGPNGEIDDANDAFLRTVGYTRHDLRNGLNWNDLTVPEYVDVSWRAYREVLEHGFAAPFEKEYIRKDGSRVPVIVGPANLEDTQQTCAFVLDISEQKRTENELKRIAAELARSNADLQQFAYIVSHDLQEPLRMVAGFLDILKKRHVDRLDQDATRLIDYATEAASGMQGLIQDLLEYSRVDMADPGNDPTDANASFDAALGNLRGCIEEAGADVRRMRLPRVRVNAVQLTQVFQNLIGNAVKFRRPGSAPRVRVSARRVNGNWMFSVKDNGIGIDPQQFKKLFTIFQRLNPRTRYPGTGIGLAITKKIVERHGGRVWVESTPDRGSFFHFTLPAVTPSRRRRSSSVRK